MSYALLQPWQFEVNQPGGLTHAGSPGWSTVPYPAWGVNPNQAGPARIGVGGCSACGETAPTTSKIVPVLVWAGIAAAALFLLTRGGGSLTRGRPKMAANRRMRRNGPALITPELLREVRRAHQRYGGEDEPEEWLARKVIERNKLFLGWDKIVRDSPGDFPLLSEYLPRRTHPRCLAPPRGPLLEAPR